MEAMEQTQNDHETTGQGEGAAMPATATEHVGGEPPVVDEAKPTAEVLELHPHPPVPGPYSEGEPDRIRATMADCVTEVDPGSELAGDVASCFSPEARVMFVQFYRCLVGRGQLAPLPNDELPSCLR